LAAHDYHDFMGQASERLASEYLRIRKKAKEDPGTAGDQGEENWKELLKDWLPASCHIVTKGRLLSATGVAGPQVDVIVLHPAYPPGLLGSKQYFIGGVLAAFECKTTLRSGDVEQFLKNSVANHRVVGGRIGTPYKELLSPLTYGLLAHSHVWTSPDSQVRESLYGKIDEHDKNLISHPRQRPDIICVADLATWSKTTSLNAGSLIAPETEPSADSGYFQSSGLTVTPLAAMVSQLLRRLSWEYPEMRAIATYIGHTGFQGGAYATRQWPASECLSAQVLSKLPHKYSVGQPEWWQEWGHHFP
jgi:hypothetical protein